MSDGIHEKLDVMAKDLVEIKVTLAVNTEQLAEHMRRTALLEENMEIALIPIKFGKVAAWIIGVLAAIGTAAVAIKELLIK